jgi:hypothetical protein
MPAVRMGFDSLQGFELMQRAAKAFSASTLVPKDYQGNIANCIIALEMASRMGASPLMVAQNLYVVHGRPSWSAQFLIASFNQCGRFSAIRYEWTGTKGKDDWAARAWSTELSTGEKITGPLVSIALSKAEGWYEKSGSKWKTIPELMLMYRAAGWLVRTHAPEIAMGLQTDEEIRDVYDAERASDGSFSVATTEELRETVPPAPEVSAWDKACTLLTRAETTPDLEIRALLLDEARPFVNELAGAHLEEAKAWIAEMVKE